MWRIGAHQKAYGAVAKADADTGGELRTMAGHGSVYLLTAGYAGAKSGAMATWPARKGVDATQGTGGKQPDFTPTGWAADGGAAVMFDGVGEGIEPPAGLLAGASAAWLLAAYRHNGSSGDGMVIETSADANSEPGLLIAPAGGGIIGAIYIGARDNTGGAGVDQLYNTNATSWDDTEVCVLFTWDSAQSAASECKVMVDGVDQALTTINSQDLGAISGTSYQGSIGSRGNAAITFLNGTIRHLAMGTGALTAAQKSALCIASKRHARLL